MESKRKSMDYSQKQQGSGEVEKSCCYMVKLNQVIDQDLLLQHRFSPDVFCGQE
jgi:hypothetical protein